MISRATTFCIWAILAFGAVLVGDAVSTRILQVVGK
jgi:hypothetical protein